MSMFRPDKFLFIFTLLSGTLIAISSPSWFIRWVGLELNLLSFIPFIFSEKNLYSSERSLKYFLIQAIGSIVLLIRATSATLIENLPEKGILLGLFLKIGAAPLHFWLPTIIQGLSWGRCLTLITVQKIAPIVITLYTISPSTKPIWIGASLISAILGGMGGLNQTFIRKILAYSSISHIGWILAAIYMDVNNWRLYFVVYSFTSLTLIIVLHSAQIYHTNQLYSLTSNPIVIVILFITLFSLGGLPPLLGFLPKIRVVINITMYSSTVWSFILVIRSLITLYFYTRLLTACFTLKTPKLAISTTKLDLITAILSSLNLLLLFFPLYF